ncbi:hypothetical protein ACFFLK_06990, partial [Oceanisphaera arctica]
SRRRIIPFLKNCACQATPGELLLLTLLLKRLIVNSAAPGLSLFKAAKNADVWFCPVMTAISQRAMLEIEHHLEWAFQYLRRNAQPSQQSKSNQGKGLYNIYEHFNA